MKTKTDYITITNNNFYITIPNNKIILECAEFYIKSGFAGTYSYLTMNDEKFKLENSIQNINIPKIICEKLYATTNANINELNVINDAFINNTSTNDLSVFNNTSIKNLIVTNDAILPKINSW